MKRLRRRTEVHISVCCNNLSRFIIIIIVVVFVVVVVFVFAI